MIDPVSALMNVAVGSTAVLKRCLRHVRYSTNSGAKAENPALRICAIKLQSAVQQKSSLFDHFAIRESSFLPRPIVAADSLLRSDQLFDPRPTLEAIMPRVVVVGWRIIRDRLETRPRLERRRAFPSMAASSKP
jgi:hypothetical protein